MAAYSTWQVSDEFVGLLTKLSARGGYEICRGIFGHEILIDNDLDNAPNNLTISKYPFLRLNSLKCFTLTKAARHNFKPAEEDEVVTGLSIAYRCPECNSYLHRYKIRVSKNDGTSFLKRKCEATSNYPLSFLSPNAMKTRLMNLQTLRKKDQKKIIQMEKKLSKLEAQLNNNESKDVKIDAKEISKKNKNLKDLKNVSGRKGRKKNTTPLEDEESSLDQPGHSRTDSPLDEDIKPDIRQLESQSEESNHYYLKEEVEDQDESSETDSMSFVHAKLARQTKKSIRPN